MKHNNDRYGRSLIRLLHELRWAISKRDAYNELCRVAPQTSWGFFSYASVALKNDMYAHAIKVLDTHKDTSSFWYINRCSPAAVKKELKNVGLNILEIKDLSDKLKTVRDKTHFHIDKKAVFSPASVWKKTGIKGDKFNKVIDGLWSVLDALHLKHFGNSISLRIYEAKDIEPLIQLAKKNGIKV